MNKIAEFAKKKGITQKALADEVGVSEATMGRYAREVRSPRIEEAKKICDILGESLDTIFGG